MTARTSGTEPPAGSGLLENLLSRGLLIATGVSGVYGHGQAFEGIRDRLSRHVSEYAAAHGAERMQFPPVIARAQLESSGYLSSFPHLVGSVFAFTGNERDAVALSERAERHEDWSAFQEMTDLMLTPAACYPVYPALAARGALPDHGVLIDTGAAWVFRREPSRDPARRQSFRMQELVRVGEPSAVEHWREESAQWALQLLTDLGLEPRVAPANDPFFGRRGRMLAANQRDERLKLEFLVDIDGPEPTAVASTNLHREHFTDHYEIASASGGQPHSACLAFGHERIVLALLRRHGLDPEAWPPAVSNRLGSD